MSSFINDYFPPLSGMKYITEYFHSELKLYSSHETGYFRENMMFDSNKTVMLPGPMLIGMLNMLNMRVEKTKWEVSHSGLDGTEDYICTILKGM